MPQEVIKEVVTAGYGVINYIGGFFVTFFSWLFTRTANRLNDIEKTQSTVNTNIEVIKNDIKNIKETMNKIDELVTRKRENYRGD